MSDWIALHMWRGTAHLGDHEQDEIAMDVTDQEAKEHDNFKEGRATKRRRKDSPSSKAPKASNATKVSKVSKSTGAICRRRSTESRVGV